METPHNNDLIDFGKLENEYEERSRTWEINHIAITKAIVHLIRQNERWPNKGEIAEEAKLSRPTVYVHLKSYNRDDLMGVDLEEFKFMSSKILARLTQRAMDGDMKAMRLAFELMGVLKKGRGASSAETEKRS
jgi:hypothetical protein